MADTLTNLQELHILATGQMANTAELSKLEASFNTSGYTQIDQTLNTSLNAKEASIGTVAMYQLLARQGLGLEITADQATKAAAALKATGVDTWAKVLHWAADDQTALSAALDNRAEAALHFRSKLIENGNSGFFSGTSIDAAAGNFIQNIGTSAASLQAGKQGLTWLAGKLGSSGIQATVAEGYYASAITHADANNNFFETPGEWGALAGDSGSFTIPANAQTGRFITTGGVDYLTHKPFKGVMMAPAGSPLVTPLTSLVQALMDKGQSMLQATATVKTALSLAANVDILTYEPRKVLLSTTTSAQDKTAAWTAEKAILQVSNTTTQIGVAIDAAGNNDSSADWSFAAYNALATVVQERGSAGTTIDLTDSNVLARVVAASDTSARLTTTAPYLVQIIDASNTAISVAAGGMALAKTATVTQGEVVEAIITGMDNNSLSTIASAYTGASLDAKIGVAHPGEIIPGVEVSLVGSATVA